MAVTRTQKEAVDPRFEAVRVAESADVPPRVDQGILDGILGLIRISQNEIRNGVEPRQRGGGQLREGVVVAIASGLHEMPHAVTGFDGPSGPFTGYEVVGRLDRSEICVPAG